MSEEKLNFDLLQDHYEPALSALLDRIVEKHKEYGTSFLDKPYPWMRERARKEIMEYRKAPNNDLSAIEALDVSICWFLIAQKHLTGQVETIEAEPKTYACPSCKHECGPDDIDGCSTFRCPECKTVFEPEEFDEEE